MLKALGRVAREARVAAGLTQLEVAVAAGTNESTIGRLEAGIRWPLDPDRIVDTYERDCGLKPGELWGRAVKARNDERPPSPKR